MSDLAPVTTPLIGSGFDDWCADCGVNPVYDSGDRCSACRDEDEFLNCSFCHGTNCTQECEDEEERDVTVGPHTTRYDPRAAAAADG